MTFLFGSACQQQRNVESFSQPGSGVGTIDWADPFGGEEFETVAAASDHLHFKPLTTDAFGDPAHVYLVTGGDIDSPRLVLSYANADIGRFLVDESPSETDEAGLKSLLACSPSAGCEGTREAVTVSNGGLGVVVAGAASTGIFFLANGILLDVYGPPGEFSRDEAVQVADAFASAAG